MEQKLDELQLSDEQRNVIDALIKEQVKIKVEEAAAAERPATQSEGTPSEGGDTRLERPAGSESSPRPEDQPRSPADVSLIDTLARALQRVKIRPEDEYREVPTPKETIRISAGNTDANISALKVEHGTEAVDRAFKAWQLIISKIQVPTIVPAILDSGSPTESWDQFLNFCRVHAESDKLELQGQWYSLKQQVGEEPRRYLTRASVLRQKLEAYGWVQSDHDANVHYVRNLLPDFNVQRSVLLAHSEVKTELVEKVILTAWAETEAARKRASESVWAYALVTGGDNRGGGGGNMGDRGKTRGQRRTAARQQQQQPQQPQQQHQPYFKQQQQRGWGGPSGGQGASYGGRHGPQHGGRGFSGGGRHQQQPAGGRFGGRGAASGGRGRGPFHQGPPGSNLPAYPVPQRGYDYSAYPPHMYHPQGNEPPIHPNDPRKRCENCGELGHNHLFCPSRVDVGRPAGMPAAYAPPRPPPPRPPAGGYSQRPPWAHSYGQANTAQQYGGEGVEPGAAGATVAKMAAPSTGGHAVTHVTGVYQQPVTHASGVSVVFSSASQVPHGMELVAVPGLPSPDISIFQESNDDDDRGCIPYTEQGDYEWAVYLLEQREVPEDPYELLDLMFEAGFANVFDDVAFAVPVMAPGKRPFSAKETKAGVPHQSGTRAERPHDLWHIDLCGPMTASLGDSFFMIMFVDSFSRWMKLYGMRRKSDNLAFVKKFLADRSGTGVPRSFRMDNGGEFVSRDFIAFCDNAGIRRTYTAPGTPQQNGPAESAIWRVNKAGHAARLEARRLFPKIDFTRARCLFPKIDFTRVPGFGRDGERLWLESCHWAAGKIDFTRVPGFGRDGERLWLESCHWAAGGFNRSPTKANVGYKSPHELFTGRPPPLQIVPFLQPGYMRVTRARKMDPHAVLCCYLNNGDNHHESVVKVLKFATGRVCMTNNVVWVSDRAPLLTPPLELPAPADEGGDSNVAAAPFLIEYISPPLLPPSPYARPPTSPAAILSQAPPATSTPPSPAAPSTAATPPPPVTAPPATPLAAAPPFTTTAPPATPLAAAPPFTTTAPRAPQFAAAPPFTTTAPRATPLAAAPPFTTTAPPATPFAVVPPPLAVAPPDAAPSTNKPPLTTRTIRELDVDRGDMRVSGRTRAAAKNQGGGGRRQCRPSLPGPVDSWTWDERRGCQGDWGVGGDLNTMVPVKNLGDLRWYSGCFYERDWDAGTLKISQQTYAEELGMEFGVEYGKEIPLPVGLKLSEFDQDEEVVSWPFRELIGSLMWLATQTRPDIANAVLVFWGLSMEVFADADYASKAADRRSVSGGLVMCGGGQNPISNSNSRHIDVRHHFIRELVGRKEISIFHVESAYQHADFLTKALHAGDFEFHRNYVMSMD
ncbi:unnamed protein product [Ectocarpus sp. CCAP 1310/34]|nr:unnamed protein product [Ectocarpus sp. CCAP 1310/34]